MEVRPIPRLVFDVASGPAICVAIMDLGNRFRLVLNEVDVVEPEQPLPKLPVARALWEPRPNLPVAATSWILAGGSHHSGFSQAVTTEHIKDFAEIAGLELLIIDGNTNVWILSSSSNSMKCIIRCAGVSKEI